MEGVGELSLQEEFIVVIAIHTTERKWIESTPSWCVMVISFATQIVY